MPVKRFVCRCEDITVEDCQAAVADGLEHFEDLKRFLGVGTGPCQGKACVIATMRLLAADTGRSPADLDVMTFRPPLRPVALGTLAAEAEDEADVVDEADAEDEE